MLPTKIKYFFKKRKEKDAITGNVTKEIPAAEPIELEIPLLGIEDLAALLNGGDEKVLALILESVNNVIVEQVRDVVNDDPEAVRAKGIESADIYDFVKIAHMPPAQRRGSGLPDEVWEAFTADYIAVMQHHGKDAKKAETGAKLLARKFAPVKSNKKVVGMLKENLQTWFTNSEKSGELQVVYELLMGKADQLLEVDEEALAAAI